MTPPKPIHTLAPALLAFSAFAEKDHRPNILFIFSDDHALKAISAYGGPLAKVAPTPNIDQIAKEGALFENSFCCNAICGPSRAAILTGKHSHKNGFMVNIRNLNPLDGFRSRATTGLNMNQWLFPRELQKAGYQTALIGKWHLESKPKGFEHWDILPEQGNYYNPNFLTEGNYFNEYTKTRVTGYVTDIITDKGLSFLKKRDKNKPFMLMLQHKAPHRTFSPAPRHLGAFDSVIIPEPETLFDNYKHRSVTLQANEMSIANHFRWSYDAKIPMYMRRNVELPGSRRHGSLPEYNRMNSQQKSSWDTHFKPKNQAFISAFKAGKLNLKDVIRWQYQRYIKNYLSTVKAVDESVGRVLNYLDNNNLAENTIVIYSSDQGFYLGEHGWYDKRWMYEESFKMPFLIRWPGVIKAGSRPKAMIQNIDYAPTFLEMAGLKPPPEVQGKSMLPMLKSLEKDHSHFRNSVYYAYYEHGIHFVPQHYGVRTERYKLIYFPDTEEWDLYDLQEDPNEMKSVYNTPKYAEIQKKMHLEFDRLRDHYDAPAKFFKDPRRKYRYQTLRRK